MMTKNAKKGRRDARLEKATLALQAFGETRRHTQCGVQENNEARKGLENIGERGTN